MQEEAKPSTKEELEGERIFALARELSFAAMVTALGILVPILFHGFGAGAVFLPMHLPILAGGLLLSPGMAVLAAFVTPLASAALTGMPPLSPPVALFMAFELPMIAGVASVLHRKLGLNPWVAAVGAIVCGRAAYAAELWLVAPLLHVKLPAAAAGLAALAKGLPGIVLQLAIIPPLVVGLERRRR